MIFKGILKNMIKGLFSVRKGIRSRIYFLKDLLDICFGALFRYIKVFVEGFVWVFV